MTPTMLGPDGYGQPLRQTKALPVVDLADARILSHGIPLPPRLARTRCKEWQHYCILSPDALITTAIVDAKILRMCWVQVVDLATGERWEHLHSHPRPDAAVARSLWDEPSWYRTHGFGVRYRSHLDAQQHTLDVRARATRKVPAMHGALTLHHAPSVEGIVVAMPLEGRRFAYSHKVPLPAAGQITVGDRTFDFDPASAVAILDIHKAHYPRHMFWKWATCAGYDVDGRLVGFNLTKNPVKEDHVWNENGIWVDGTVTPVGPAVFDFDAEDPHQPWRVRSADEAIDLRFEPLGSRGENLHVPPIVTSQFTQLYGRFSGTMRTAGGTVTVDNLWGLCEDHTSVW